MENMNDRILENRAAHDDVDGVLPHGHEEKTSIATCTRNQNDALALSLENWLRFDVREIVVVDFRDNSCESAASVVDRFNDSRIKLVETLHEYRLIPTPAWNLAISCAEGQFLLRMTSGTLLHEKFFGETKLGEREFACDTPPAPREGFLFIEKRHWEEIGGYNENMTYLGHEEPDIRERLERNGMISVPVREGLISHAIVDRQEEFLRKSGTVVGDCDEENAGKVLAAFRDANNFLRNTFPWGAESVATAWNLLEISPNRFQAVRKM